MTPKMSRPAAPGRAHRAETSEGLGGAFDPEISDETGELQDSVAPMAQTRIVIGCRHSFIYIPYCSLCGLEHVHHQFPLRGRGSDPLHAFEWHGGIRAAHCFCQGPGRYARFVRGRWRTFFVRPAEWREPEGQSYCLVLGPDPACFTPLGIRSGAAHNAMVALAARGVATSLQILRPRRSFVVRRGDQ